MTQYRDLITDYGQMLERLLNERGWKCELCGQPSQFLDLDHAIYSKAKYRQDISELDEGHNLIILCRQCHTCKPQNYAEWAWEQNCVRYGHDVMEDWRDRVPLKIKSL